MMEERSPRLNQKVCFIAGAGHSGSTLLGFILGSHSDSFYCGEAAKTRYLHDERKNLIKRVCKLCGLDCPVWRDLVLDDQLDLYEQIARKVDKSLVIDSAKNVDWIQQQLARLQPTTAQAFLIFLQRDGRAVINSRVRKYPHKAPEHLIENWKEQIQATNLLFEAFQGKKIKVHYEELATHPALITQQLCDFLSIEYEPTMLDYANHEHHVLGGNNGTQFLVAKAQSDRLKQPMVNLSESNKSYYEKRDSSIFLDLRWKQELNPEIAQLFDEIAGKENEELQWNTV